MILSSAQEIEQYGNSGLWGQLSLDELFQLAAQQNPDQIALADPPDRRRFTEGAPRRLTFSEASDAVEALARQFVALGLEPDDVVVVQLGNTVEAYLTLLAIMRAHLIACPVSPLWREFELARALPQIAPRAIITASRIDGHAHADMMRFVASNVMSVRHVMSTGSNLPDGVTTIEEALGGSGMLPGIALPPRRRGSANHIATICFDQGGRGAPRPVARSHNQWLTAGLLHIAASGLNHGETILNPYFPIGLTAIAGAFVPAIISASTLALHHALDLGTLADSLVETGAAYTMLPPSVIEAMARGKKLNGPEMKLRRIGCVWPPCPPVQEAGDAATETDGIEIVDIYRFGELATYAARRKPDTVPGRIPLGAIPVATDTADAPTVLETRIHGAMHKAGSGDGGLTGELELRGAMVPGYRIGTSSERQGEEAAENGGGFVECRVRARLCRTDPPQFELLPPDGETFHIGQITVSASELEDTLRSHDTIADAAIVTQADPILGIRMLAAVVGKYGETPGDEVRSFLKDQKFARHKLPERVVAVRRIPRDAEGKVDRAQLAAMIGS